MRGLITDLLDVARIETGILSTSTEASEQSLLVDRAWNSFPSGGGRNQIHIDMEPGLPKGPADRRNIVQVLVNLLNNSARHSPEPSVITGSARRDGVHVVFSVADEGVGVPHDKTPPALILARCRRERGGTCRASAIPVYEALMQCREEP